MGRTPMWCCSARSMNMSFPKFQQDWGSESRTVKQRKTLEKQQKRALRSRQERIANEILMYFRSRKKAAQDISLFDPIDTDKDGNALTLGDLMADEGNILDEIDLSIRSEQLHRFIKERLEPREQEILHWRYGLGRGLPHTQRETAARLGISRSYVSRIEKKAIEKLRTAFREMGITD